MRSSAPPSFGRSTATWPPCDSATWRTIANPSPEPGKRAGRRGTVEAIEDEGQVCLVDPPARDRER